MKTMQNRIEQLTAQVLPEITEIRRSLHREPELSFREIKTSAFIKETLTRWGIPFKAPYVTTGLMAVIHGKGKDGKVIGLRADMDALPVTENTGLPFASVNDGVMHACGHDMHMSSLLGTLKILNELKNEFSGTVLGIFQPGEEKLPGGAGLMLEEGIFNEYKPEILLAQHVLPEMDAGTIGMRPGIYMASSDEIYLTVKGTGGHGALPEKIHDPVLMSAHILITLQQEINRRSPKGIPTVLSFGKVIANGAVNVIPNEVAIEGTFRTMDETWRNEAHEMIIRIAEGLANTMGGSCEINIMKGYPVLENNPKVTALAGDYARELLGPAKVEQLKIRMTAEDFAWFTQKYPSLMYRLGVRKPGAAKSFSLHTPDFVVDESALKTGISTMAWLAMRFLDRGLMLDQL